MTERRFVWLSPILFIAAPSCSCISFTDNYQQCSLLVESYLNSFSSVSWHCGSWYWTHSQMPTTSTPWEGVVSTKLLKHQEHFISKPILPGTKQISSGGRNTLNFPKKTLGLLCQYQYKYLLYHMKTPSHFYVLPAWWPMGPQHEQDQVSILGKLI